ncbi:hypothetical protein NIES73_48810 [Sphaerospermopsis kisseleviana NIES-73]|nr:hypothetical protein NIES73_48810 [Sphaerospermopsis kisseleviana NIES-73]
MRRRFPPGTDVTIILPPGADKLPVLTTVPPMMFKFLPAPTAKLPRLTILPVCVVEKAKPLGVPTKFV